MGVQSEVKVQREQQVARMLALLREGLLLRSRTVFTLHHCCT